MSTLQILMCAGHRLVALGAELDEAVARQDELESRWLELADQVGES